MTAYFVWVTKLKRVGGSAILACAVGCQQRMAEQPSVRPLDPSSFFADGRSAREPPLGTVARGHLRVDSVLYTGRRETTDLEQVDTDGTAHDTVASPRAPAAITRAAEAAQEANWVDTFPFAITDEVLEHGRHRYMIFCVVCHDAAGTGHGKIVERGYTRPPSYHIDRLREAPVGRLYAVITAGYGSMPSYAAQIPPCDRWAIVAYLRALQLSQHFPRAELTEQMRTAWARQSNTTAEGALP